jgi:hypothetical protein
MKLAISQKTKNFKKVTLAVQNTMTPGKTGGKFE